MEVKEMQLERGWQLVKNTSAVSSESRREYDVYSTCCVLPVTDQTKSKWKQIKPTL